LWQRFQRPPQRLHVFPLRRIVVAAAWNDDELFWFVGGAEKPSTKFDWNDRIGVAVSLKQRTMVVSDLVL
jgi:hypothetical protein